MEFSITCPIDGQIDVGLEDIDTVVLRDAERADITFMCPHCGTQITVTAIVPAFLLAAMEALADEGGPELEGMVVVSGAMGGTSGPDVRFDDPRADSYCEYFRRQLDHVTDVEDALDEIDSKAPSR